MHSLLIVLEHLVCLTAATIGLNEQTCESFPLDEVAFSHVLEQFCLLGEYLGEHLVQDLNSLLVLLGLAQAYGLVEEHFALLARRQLGCLRLARHLCDLRQLE